MAGSPKKKKTKLAHSPKKKKTKKSVIQRKHSDKNIKSALDDIEE